MGLGYSNSMLLENICRDQWHDFVNTAETGGHLKKRISSKSAQAHTNSSFYPIDSRYFCHFQTTFWLQKKNQTLKRRLKQAMSFVFHESTSSPRNYSPVVIHAVHYKQSIRNVRK
ncbi:hypothetical protein YC2023_032015 [Brassica napus]